MRPSHEQIEQLCTAIKLNHSTIPRWQQLYEALRQQILDGFLLPQMCLPSSRIIAQKLNLSRNTVLAAIEQLCAEGYARARPKSGIYILPTAPIGWQQQEILQTPRPHKPLFSLRGKKISAQLPLEPKRGAFTLGPDLKQFPFAIWQRYVARYAKNPKLDWLNNPYQGGELALRKTLASHLRIARGIHCHPEQILLTQGTQHSLRMIADLLADPGDIAWLEDPGYLGAHYAFEAAGLINIPQPVDQEGILPCDNAWREPPRLLYVTPSHQFPTGVVMSAARRRYLLGLATKHQTWVIEDDYDGEFRYAGAPIAALHALAPKQVIYLGSFSKIFFPSFRVGYMVLPEHLVEVFRRTQARHYREPSYIIQKALLDFMHDGHMTNHIRRMRQEYQLRRNLLLKLLHDELGDLIRVVGADTGMHLTAYLKNALIDDFRDLHDQFIATAAQKNGINVTPLSSFYLSENSNKMPALLLGFGDANQHDIIRAGKILTKIILQNIR